MKKQNEQGKIRIEISIADFIELVALSGATKDDPTLLPLHKMIDNKINAIAKNNYYTEYKTAPTPEQREAARQRYLDEIGVPKEFRW